MGFFKHFNLFFISSFCLPKPLSDLALNLLPIPCIMIISSLPFRSGFIRWILTWSSLQRLFTLPFSEMTESCTNSCTPWLSAVLISCFLFCPPLQLEFVSPDTSDLFSNSLKVPSSPLTILEHSQPPVQSVLLPVPPHLTLADVTSFLCLLIALFC